MQTKGHAPKGGWELTLSQIVSLDGIPIQGKDFWLQNLLLQGGSTLFGSAAGLLLHSSLVWNMVILISWNNIYPFCNSYVFLGVCNRNKIPAGYQIRSSEPRESEITYGHQKGFWKQDEGRKKWKSRNSFQTMKTGIQTTIFAYNQTAPCLKKQAIGLA